MILPHDHQVAAWLADDAHEAPPDSLARALAATRRTRKRPRWTFPARWLPMELTMTRTPMRRPILGLVMLALLIAALVATSVFVGSERTDLPISGGMWPQSDAAEVAEAQERADAGDPDYSWQVDPLLAADAWAYLEVNDPAPAIVDRFLRERLGWDHYMFLENESDFDSDDGSGSPDGMVHRRAVYLRCAAGENPLYPTAPCAPTIDDRRFETVSLDIAQPGVHGPTGIWVASVWRTPAPFVQDRPNEQAARALVEAFLAARIAGEGAEGLIDVEAR
ncbi:MAG TPA: hypothetical protein VF119_03655, partial [Candidatus Limnocylindrales bacterium]